MNPPTAPRSRRRVLVRVLQAAVGVPLLIWLWTSCGPTNAIAVDLPLVAAAFTTDGNRVVSLSGDPAVLTVADVGTRNARYVEVGGRPNDQPAVHPAGRFAYASTTSGVTVIDLDRAAVVTSIPVDRPGKLAISPDGTRLYVGRDGYLDIAVIDTATRQTVRLLHLGSSTVDLTAATSGRLVVAGDDRTVTMIDATTGAVLGAVRLAADPAQIVATADGRAVYAQGRYGHRVEQLDITAGTSRLLERERARPGLWLEPSGRRLFLGTGKARKGNRAGKAYVSVVDAVTGKELGTVDTGHNGMVTVSPDGRYLATTSDRDGHGEVRVFGVPPG